MVTPDQYFFMDEEQQRPLIQQCGAALAPIIGGQPKWRDGGDELHITGYYHGRPARMVIWVSFGTVRIELKANRQFNTDPMFHIHADKDAVQHAGESMTRDEWDDTDGTEQKLFLSAKVYFEGEPQELAALQNTFRSLPVDAQGALVQTLESFDRGDFMVTNDTLTLSCPAWVTLSPQSTQFVGYYFNLLFNLAGVMEQTFR